MPFLVRAMRHKVFTLLHQIFVPGSSEVPPNVCLYPRSVLQARSSRRVITHVDVYGRDHCSGDDCDWHMETRCDKDGRELESEASYIRRSDTSVRPKAMDDT